MSMVLAAFDDTRAAIASDGHAVQYNVETPFVTRTDCRKIFRTRSGQLVGRVGQSVLCSQLDSILRHFSSSFESCCDVARQFLKDCQPFKGEKPLGALSLIIIGRDSEGRVVAFESGRAFDDSITENVYRCDPGIRGFLAAGLTKNATELDAIVEGLPDASDFAKFLQTGLQQINAAHPIEVGGDFFAEELDGASYQVMDGPTFKRVLHVDADNTFHLSTPFVAQGSILPIIVPAGVLSYQTPATGSNQIIAVTWGAFNIALPDGTTVAVPAASALPQTAAPTLSQISGGSLAARTHFVAIALVKAGTIYAFSTENSLAISANFLLKVSSPSAVSGYDGWIPLIGGNVAGSAVFVQQNPTGTTLITPIAFGTDWTEPSTGASTTGIEVLSFAALGTRQAIQVTGLAASTTYHLYLTYNKTMNQVLIPNGARASSDVTAAALAWADGTINLLNNGSASVATGSAGGGTSGTIGGRLV